ncbi:MAG TPA: hypothetical protein VFW07_08500 [Parafilimonas sp.]|nr:hypothetical protein [Parafilimonas sp.]
MKKNSWAVICNLLMVCFCLSCSHSHHNVNIHISESEHYYKMQAQFNAGKTAEVDEFMDHKIGRRSHMSFVHSRIDGKIALDDHTIFYIKKYPGYLRIKLDKKENSAQAYQRIKLMCEGIKKVISQ